MFTHRTLLALAFALVPLLSLAGCAAVPAGVDSAFYVVRHLHTPAGERDPDLTEEGRRHALLLSERLSSDPPSAIYVTHFKRTQQTAAPVAARLGITPVVYDPADTPRLIARVSAARGSVLIVGHSNTVPDIVEQLGGPRPAPLVHEDFGDLWRISRTGGGTVKERIGGR